MSAAGVKETKDIIVTIAKFANAAGEIMQDGQVNVFDLVHLYAPLMSLNAAVQGAGEVPTELAAMDADGVAELKTTFVNEFSIPEAVAQEAVVKAVSVACDLLTLALSLRKNSVPVPAA